METFILNGKTHVKRDQLYNWDFNLNTIQADNFQKLVQARYDFIPVEPLLVMPDGLVLGGNHRNLADQELGVENEWVEIIDFVQDGDRWYVVQDGEVQKNKRNFATREEAMTTYSLVHNARYAGLDPEKLANLTDTPGFETMDFSEFPVLVGKPFSVQEFIDRVAPEESSVGQVETPPEITPERKESAPKEEKQITVKCPDCGCRFSASA